MAVGIIWGIILAALILSRTGVTVQSWEGCCRTLSPCAGGQETGSECPEAIQCVTRSWPMSLSWSYKVE